jgi:ankyrin repeat protein
MTKASTIIVGIISGLIGLGYYLDPNGDVIQEYFGSSEVLEVDVNLNNLHFDDMKVPDHVKPGDVDKYFETRKAQMEKESSAEQDLDVESEGVPVTQATKVVYQYKDLIAAYTAREPAKVLEIINSQPTIAKSTDQNGWTFLHEIARDPQKFTNILKIIIHSDLADVNARNGRLRDQETVLDVALANLPDDHEVVRFLRSNGAKTRIEMDYEFYRPTLYDAMKAKDLDTVADILKKSELEFPFRRDANGWTLLHEAVRLGDLHIISAVVEVGKADVNARNGKNHNHDTALDIAVQFLEDEQGREVMRYLMQFGAKTSHELDMAKYSHEDLVRAALIDKDMEEFHHILRVRPELVHAKDENGWTILHEATRGGNMEVVKILVEETDADIHVRNGKRGDLDHAVDIANKFLDKQHEVVAYLNDVEMKKKARKLELSTDHVLKACVENDIEGASSILKEKPELAHELDENGWSILHEVVRFGNLPLTTLLVETYGAALNLRTKKNGKPQQGGSPLYYAMQSLGSDQHPVVKYLVAQGAEFIEPTVEVREGEEEEL